MKQQTKGTLLVLISAAGFATLGIFIKFAYAAGASMITILSARFCLASVLLYLVVKCRGLSMAVGKPMMIKLCLMGIAGYGLMSMTFATALHYLPASLNAMLLYTYPAIVCILSFLLGDEVFTWQKGTALTICLAGLIMVLGVSFTNVPPVGIALGLISSLVYSCYLIAGNRLLKAVNSIIATTYICISAGLCFALYGLITGSFTFDLPLSAWVSMLGITLFATVIAILFVFAGMVYTGAANASIISTAEPVITVLLAVLLLDEKITPWQASGGVLILAGIMILQLWAKDEDNHLTAEDAEYAEGK